MARIKGWKKHDGEFRVGNIIKNKNNIIYVNLRNEQRIIDISQQGKNIYSLRIAFYDIKEAFDRDFDTLDKAKKFALKYMRSHPNG